MEEETKILPTVGRLVHYKMPNGEIRPANVVSVINEDMVNLQVITDGINDVEMFRKDGGVGDMIMTARGLLHRTSVVRGEGVGEWDWMPYQKGQAKKTEETEKKLEEATATQPDAKTPSDIPGVSNEALERGEDIPADEKKEIAENAEETTPPSEDRPTVSKDVAEKTAEENKAEAKTATEKTQEEATN